MLFKKVNLNIYRNYTVQYTSILVHK